MTIAIQPAATAHADPVDHLLEIGLKDLWYPICPSHFIKENPVSLRRLGRKIALWRDGDRRAARAGRPLPAPRRAAVAGRGAGRPHLLPVPRRRGAPRRRGHPRARQPRLQAGRLAGRAALPCAGARRRRVPVQREDPHVDTPPPLVLPEQLTDDAEYGSFLCYTEWKGDYRYVLDNVMDPMHGTFLHKQSHSMAEGDSSGRVRQSARPTTGFVFEKKASATSTSTGPSGPTPASTGCGWRSRTRRPAAPAATSSSSAATRRWPTA
jgi:phenylpropionate dioxygenase-like ring-hydroxylating dioxygenase large terminal subunit